MDVLAEPTAPVACASDCSPLATDDADWHARALSAYERGELARARECMRIALRARPLDVSALADLAALDWEAGDAKGAARGARRALMLDPTCRPALLVLASVEGALGRPEVARGHLATLLNSAPLEERGDPLLAAATAQWTALTGSAPTGTASLQVVEPARLLLRDRFDVLAKMLYARRRLGLLPPWLHPRVDTLYRRHIHVRTGGREPGDESRKGSMADFVSAFDTLVDDMAAHGFRPEHPVPLSVEDDLPRNGAHRLAAALAVGCAVTTVRESGAGGRWGLDWFRDHGFDRDDRNLMLRAWAGVKGNMAHVALLWSPVESAWPRIEAELDAVMPVVAARTIDLPRVAFDEMVHDVYSHDWGPRSGDNIHRKVGLLADHPPRVRLLFLERPVELAPDAARQLKQRLREDWSALSPVDHFTCLHLSESAAETDHLLRMFASENNLRWLRLRATLRTAVIDRLVAFHHHVGGLGMRPTDCCVVGASVLDVFGLRAADDVDFTLRSELRARHFHEGVTALGPTLDVVSAGYPRSFSDEPAVSDDRLIDDPDCHFLVRGVPFADPRIVLTRKQHQRRDKDIRDLGLLTGFLDASGTAD